MSRMSYFYLIVRVDYDGDDIEYGYNTKMGLMGRLTSLSDGALEGRDVVRLRSACPNMTARWPARDFLESKGTLR